METAPAFLTSETTEDVVIRTTLDPKLQRAAEEALAWVFENKPLLFESPVSYEAADPGDLTDQPDEPANETGDDDEEENELDEEVAR